MPFEPMDGRGVSASSHFYEDVRFHERQVRFWESMAMPDRQVSYRGRSVSLSAGTDGMLSTGSKSVASLPLEKKSAGGAQCMELPEAYLARGLEDSLIVGGEATKTALKSSDLPLKSWSNSSMQPESYSLDGKRMDMNGTQFESSLFSCSLSEILSRKMRLSGNVVHPLPANGLASQYDKKPAESLEEIEAKTIGNLLPDEEDLFSGMTDELGYSTNVNGGDDLEDFDLFSSGGGMELEGTNRVSAMRTHSDFIGGISTGQVIPNGSVVGEHPYGEHPSRTLFVRNINSNVEDSELKSIFEQYGDLRTLYTACKHRGFVMISYYDLRAARNAMRELQNKTLRRRNLDIHYSIPKDNPSEKDVNHGALVVFNLDSSVSNGDLLQIFGIYGDIKEIRETPYKNHHKFIEFYDIRAAEIALRALNKIDIAGKQIKLEPSQPGGSKRLVQISVQERDEPNLSHSSYDMLSSGCIVVVSPGIITSAGLDGVSAQSLNSKMRSPVSAFIDNAFSHQTSGTLSSPMGMTPLDMKLDVRGPNPSVNEVKFQSQYIPCFHPHSLPEYHDNLTNGIPYTSRNIANMAGSVGTRVGSNGHSMEFNRGVFGSSGNGNCPPHEQHHVWSNSNSYQHNLSSPVIWSNSPSFSSGVHAHRLRQMPGFPRAPPHILNSASPVNHHVGSAPVVNPSLWDRGHTFSGESPEASNFHLGSLGNVGFTGGSPLNRMEIASRSIYSRVGGNGLDMAANAPQQMCHIFPGGNGNPMLPMQASFDYTNDRVRSLSHRRNDINSNNADKKQFELDVDRIRCGDDTRTTLMIKNIPNKYTSKMLLAAIDEHCRGYYDFIYLPIDFKNKCNVGYAFINMADPQKIIPFYQAFNGKKWEKFNSEKVAYLAYARIQGKAALVAHFQNSSLMNEDKRCRPILFHTAGPNAGDQEPFPMGTNIRSRPGKARSSGNDDNNQGNLSTFGDGEESCNGTDSSSGSIKNSD